MSKRAYWVVIEWDGMKPNNAFYHRLHMLTSGVRGDKDESPIARRSIKNKTAVIVQESAIYCQDYQLARAIGLLAQRYGAKDVLMSVATETTPIEADEQDLQALARIDSIAGRRGRRPADTFSEDKSWLIWCYNEMEQHVVPPGRKPINCPECGSFMCEVVPAPDHVYNTLLWGAGESYPQDIVKLWADMRFDGRGNFMSVSNITCLTQSDGRSWVHGIHREELGRYDSQDADEIIFSCIHYSQWKHNGAKVKALKKILTSDLSFIDAFADDPINAIRLLDALYVSQMYMRPSQRQEERIAAIVRVLSDHHDISITQLAEKEDELDMFDCAAHIDHTMLSNLFTDVDNFFKDENIAPTFYQRNVAEF